jgi:NAD(P)-dependent dehydrogenase (short-subunit alcohol dehydrogenase family)
MGRLAGKVAIVTGGAGGIGSATVRALTDAGAQVVVADIDIARAKDVAQTVVGALAIEVDLAEESSVIGLVAQTISAFGRIDVLHNNAALTSAAMLERDQDVTSMELEVWEAMFAINLRSQMLTCKHVVPHMVAVGGGSIINMSSGAANTGDVTRLAYGVSKAGVAALTRYVSTSHGKQGVRVNTIVPGLIMTDPVRAQIPPDLLEGLSAATATPWLGRPEDIAELVVFLASDESRYVTGQSIAVDGGASTSAAHALRG